MTTRAIDAPWPGDGTEIFAQVAPARATAAAEAIRSGAVVSVTAAVAGMAKRS